MREMFCLIHVNTVQLASSRLTAVLYSSRSGNGEVNGKGKEKEACAASSCSASL
jgi:hypothetical protein